MPYSFDIATDSPVTVEQVHAAFASADYWRDRHDEFDVPSTLDELSVAADGAVTVRLTQQLGSRWLPAAVGRLVPGELRIEHLETWTPVGDRVRGEITVSAPASLGACRLTGWLTPTASAGTATAGSQLRFAATVAVRVPVIGDRLAKAVGKDLAENIRRIHQFTSVWIDAHPGLTNTEGRR